MRKFSVLIVFSCAILQIFTSGSANAELAKNDEEEFDKKFKSDFLDDFYIVDEFEEVDLNKDDLEVKEWKVLLNENSRRKRSDDNLLDQENPLITGTVDEISQYKNDTISKTTFVFYKVRKQINNLVATQVSSVKMCITDAEDSLRREYEELSKFTRDTQLEADEDGTDIQKCFNYTKDISVNGIFSDCEIKEQPSFINTQNEALDEAERDFNEDIKSCENQDETDVNQCIQATVDSTKIKVFKIKKSTEMLISIDNASHFKCIETIFRKLDDGMNKAAKEFNACVEQIMDANA